MNKAFTKEEVEVEPFVAPRDKLESAKRSAAATLLAQTIRLSPRSTA